ncbi:MAG: hypothetical protein AAFQ43_11745 [Bacteroidota bacterium]
MAAPDLETVPADAHVGGAFSRVIETYNHGAADRLFLRPSGVAVAEVWFVLGTGGSIGSVDVGRWETVEHGVRLTDLIRMSSDCKSTEPFGSDIVCTRDEERIPDRYLAYTDTEDGVGFTEYLACTEGAYITHRYTFDGPIEDIETQ